MALVYAGVCSHAPGITGRADQADPGVRDAFYAAFDKMRNDIEGSGAEALIVVGAMMMRAIRQVEWDDITEALPAFLAMVSMAFTFSIATGIAIGFISYAFAKLVTLRPRQCPLIVYIFAVLFVAQYVVGLLTGALH